jgi:exodeoxyribonuclease V alpha subunit
MAYSGGIVSEEQIRVEIERVTYRNEDNGWTVLRGIGLADKEPMTATGHFVNIGKGEQFEFFGAWTKHSQYGKQFKIERVVPIRPTKGPAIEKYLSSGLIKGIGPKTASKIVDHFGDATLDILETAPERINEISSIGHKKAKAIIDSWRAQRGVADVMMFLNQHGVSPLFAARIFKLYGNEAISLVSADPYRLAVDIQGIGFRSADKIANEMGIASDSPQRIQAAILYQLQQGEDRGHCYITTPQLIASLQETLGLDENTIRGSLGDRLGHLNEVGAVISEKIDCPDGGTTSAHFRIDLLTAELNIVSRIKALLANPLKSDESRITAWIQKYAEASGTPLSEEQLAAVNTAANQRVFILTGGPGVGKTTTANAIIRLLKAMGNTVALGAPTGRAAQRLTEVAAAPAKTIHRMLEWVPKMHCFGRNEDNPLTAQTIIIDEASMLDVRLADALLRAVPDSAQLILIGDVDQLPSVGPGNVLRDLIDSTEVPYSRLTEIFRQAQTSNIVRTAHAINNGDKPELSAPGNGDCWFIDVDTGADIKDQIKTLVTRTLPQQFGLDPMQDIQILSPMNRGELGTIAINEEMQALLNPAVTGQQEYKRGNLILRRGDKVIQSSNNYDLSVFNGDIGFVLETKVEGGRLMVQFGDRPIVYDDDQAMDLRLAYAITIHKSQGSEFPAVIIPASMQHYVMLQRNLIYTGLTRARKLAVFVGSRKALSYAVNNQHSSQRQTCLIERLRQ